MRRTAWLIGLCWRLPENDPVRTELLPALFRRLGMVGGHEANDACAPRMLRIVPLLPRGSLASGGGGRGRILAANRVELRK